MVEFAVESPGGERTAGRRLVRSSLVGLELLFALVPMLMIGYVQLFQDPGLSFKHHLFHELAILLATVVGGGLSWVTWRCYLASGERFLRWLGFGFLGFTLIYAPHGVFTRMGDHNLWLFILYGPVSRVVMASCLLIGMWQAGRPADTPEQRTNPGLLRWAVALFLVLDGLVYLLASSPVANAVWVRAGLEWIAISLCCGSLVHWAVRRHRSPLFNLFAYALVSFALSSWAFTMARPWNHQWWLAHLVFAGGFLLLGYGVLQAWLTTRSFSGVFSQEELFRRLQHALAETRAANQALMAQAAAAEAARDEFESLFAMAPDGMVLVDAEGAIRKANASLARMFGYGIDTMDRLEVDQLLPVSLRAIHRGRREAYQAAPTARLMGGVGVQRGVRQDGSVFPCEINLAPLSFRGIPCTIAVVRDMSHSERLQEALRLRERTLEAVLQALPVGVWIADTGGQVASANLAALSLWGNVQDPSRLPEGRLRHVEDGRPFLSGELALNRVLLSGGRVTEQLLLLDTPEGETRTVVSSAIEIRGEGNEGLGAVAVFQDMSRWLALEKELFDKTRRLEESNRELEQFAYVASHDLQEPLRKVSSFVQLFARRYESLVDETGRSYIHFAVDGAARMRNLIDDLLSYSRVSRAERTSVPVDLNLLVPEVLADLELGIHEAGVDVVLGELPRVRGDAGQLRALFQNLLSNAVKYRQHEAPRIEIGGSSEGGMVTLWVRDNGIGIDPAYFERIFVIFQRLHTREEYPGTGIGLAICRKIVESHGGRMWVESAPERGSRFFFTLPLDHKGAA